MKSKTRYRFVRRAICVVAAIIIAALWGRSVVACDYLWISTGQTHFVVASCDGYASISGTSTTPAPMRIPGTTVIDNRPIPNWRIEFDYYYYRNRSFQEVRSPHSPMLFGTDMPIGIWMLAIKEQQLKLPDPRDVLNYDQYSSTRPSPFDATVRIIRLPYWLLLLIPIALLIKSEIAAAKMFNSLERDAARQGFSNCPSCGYDMRGTPDKCPECGFEPPHREHAKSK